MVTTDVGACEWFIWDLRRSNLIDRGQLDQLIEQFLANNPGAEPPALAGHLISLELLTEFQAERLLQGKTQGFVMGPFTLTDSLGSGSMGTVYKALSKTDSQFYAVKVLPRRSMWNVRIARRKVRLFEQCQHPAVVPFIDVGTAGGMHYLAWPLVEGTPLDKVMQKESRIAPNLAAQYVLQAAEGLELCHQQKLIHGLIKPSNLILGTNGQIRILDFGIGCLLAETEGESLVDTMSTANSVNSGLDCASPESIMDPTNLTPSGDQYSLGCVLYYFVAGQYPFPDGTAVEKMMGHQHKQPQPIRELVPTLPDGLVAVIEKLMSKPPEDRYPNCAEVVEALRPFATSELVQPRLRPALRPLPRSEKASSPLIAPTTPANTARAGLRGSGSLRASPRPVPPLPARSPSSNSGIPRSSSARLEALRPKPLARGPLPAPQAASLRVPAASPAPLARRAATPVPTQWEENQDSNSGSVLEGDEETTADETNAPSTLSQRLGTFGILVVAIAAGALAWLLSSSLPLKF